jgi:hypothetical protein
VRRRAAALLPALLLFAAGPARADEVPAEPTPPPARPEQRQLEQPPRYGSYYSRYEPTFYTGFAPRALDPRRIHLHVGRGNQLRITLVLSDAGIASYARDLEVRRATYRRLVDEERIVLTQNRGLEAFEAALDEAALDERVAYFVAYSLRSKRPHRLRVRDERSAYYDWLYAGEFELAGDGRGSFAGIHDGRFIERTAKKGARCDRVPLYEAAYEPERFQFYRLVDIPFARELRKLGADHPFGSTAASPAP